MSTTQIQQAVLDERLSETSRIIDYVITCAEYWEDEAERCSRNQPAVDSAAAKARVLRGVAQDLKEGRHHP